MTQNKKIIVITGPTATGKTALGAHLAKHLGGEVISADSMQIYKHMDIGTAKPRREETLGVAHHMLDLAEPFENYSAARYVKEASKCADDILMRRKTPVIVGGTGLYIDSLIKGTSFSARDDALRTELERQYDELGGAQMLSRLAVFDPDCAARLHTNDKKRIVRAIEIFQITGETISRHDEKTRALPPRYDAVKIALTFSDRAVLYGRINRRVDAMLKEGLADEVRRLMDMGISRGATAMQAIGYKELAQALDGEISMAEAVEKIKTESRRYAKRQLTWLRRDTSVKWITWEKTPDLDFGLIFSTSYL